ncbi:hypothetical protein BU202_00485 [Streptococcus cuniculi]|uniref:ABC3 transporter permease C-terminal domain-containing protein n=1 Tax=Streptococcus cuniculi TaxID=1432788 RepID=A0A1Q8EAI2_9STRE|nr:FtsX-like permease family protein [Streptococcus cuniculi]OLF48802.1 hypothetical protein BU202_00485 [Streptococcus cuniculi]
MHPFTRAVLYLKRHPMKSALLTGLLFCISLALSVAVALNTSLTMDMKRLSDQQSKQFLTTLLEDGSSSPATASSRAEFEKMMSEYGLAARHLIAEEVTVASDTSEASRLYSLVNQDFFENSQLLEKQAPLETGAYPANNSSGQALISRTLADKYGLTVGDTLPIRFKNGVAYELHIVGIFKSSSLPTVSKESHSFENNIVTTKETIAHVNPDYPYHTSIYEAKTPALASQAQAALEANPEIRQAYQIKANSNLQTQLKTLHNQQQLLKVVVWGTLLLTHLLLLFFLHLWMKGRQLEIGILQSLGKSRLEIVCQYLIEVLVLASMTLVLALCITAFVLPYVRESLMRDMLTTTYANADNGEFLPAVFLTNHHSLESLMAHSVGVTLLDILVIVGSDLALSLGAVLVSCLALLKYPPKKIFATMS